MTTEEEIRANTSVAVVQRAWEDMANQAITARTEATIAQAALAVAKARIKELEEKYEPKTPAIDAPAP